MLREWFVGREAFMRFQALFGITDVDGCAWFLDTRERLG